MAERFSMDKFTSYKRKRIKEGIREKYVIVAISPEERSRYATGREGLEEIAVS
jgi:hypothetical protein